jgi:hypothetical protein
MLQNLYDNWGKSGQKRKNFREYAAIRRLIENMAVSKEFVERWKKEFSGFTEDYDAEILLKKMLTELGHEVEEREGGGD